MKKFKINGYEICYNSLWKNWIISHPEIGAGIASFNFWDFGDMIHYCVNG